jgi:hypothetical protein
MKKGGLNMVVIRMNSPSTKVSACAKTTFHSLSILVTLSSDTSSGNRMLAMCFAKSVI